MGIFSEPRTSLTRALVAGVTFTFAAMTTSAWALDITPGTLDPDGTAAAAQKAADEKFDPKKMGFDAVCGPILKNNTKTEGECADMAARDPNWKMTAECKRAEADQVLKDPNASNQLLAHCRAAQQAKSGLNANQSLATIWSGVAVVCAATCSMPWGQQVCMGGGIAATVNEAMKTQELQSLLMSFMGGKMIGGAIGGMVAGKNASQGKKDCYGTAVYAALQAMQKKQAQGSLRSAYDSSWNQVIGLYDSMGSGTDTSPSATVAAQRANIGSAISRGGRGSAGYSSPDAGLAQSADEICSTAKTGDTGATISCATAKGGALPDLVQNPKFAETYKEKTGHTLGELMKEKGGLGASDFAGAFGGGDAAHTASLEGQLKAAAAKLDPAFDPNLSAPVDAAYAQGRGSVGAGGGAADTGPDFSKLMEAAFGQAARGPASDTASGVREIDFLMKHKSAEQIAEDRRISIFDRISYRYRVNAPSLTGP